MSSAGSAEVDRQVGGSAIRRVVRNSIFQAGAFAAQGLTEFVVALLLARIVGAEQLGQFTTLIILAGLFSFISAFGLPSLLTREVSRLRDDLGEVVRLVHAAMGLVIALSALAFVAMLLVGVVSGYSAPLLRALALTALALGMESLATVTAAAFRGFEEFERSSVVLATKEIGFLLAAIPVVVLDPRIDTLMAAYALSRAMALGLALWFHWSHFGTLRPTIDRTWWPVLLRKGFPFSVNSVFAFAYSRADVVILSYLAGNVQVGYYEAAYSLTMRTNLVARALTFALYPLLSRQFVSDRPAMRRHSASGIHYLNIIGFFAAAMLWVFGGQLALLLYGPSFAAATTTALRLLAVAIPLRYLETSLAVTLDASNRAGLRARVVAVTAVANALLNVVLIPRYQMMGAVYSTLVSEILICALFTLCFRDEAREIVRWRGFLGAGVGALVVLSGAALLVTTSIWLLLSLCVVLYVLTILVLDRSSVQPLYQLARKRRA